MNPNESKRLMVIVNPVAGRGMYKQGLGEALRVLYTGGYLPTVYFTTRPGEGTSLAEACAGNYDAVCVLGGDGSLSDVVAGLMRLEKRPPVGYFPLGTANDVATTLKLPKNDPVNAARLMVQGTPLAWDIGDMGGGCYFTYVAAFGAFTDVSYETPQQTKQALGHLAYLLEGVNRLPHLPRYKTRVELDGDRVVEGSYIFGGVTNSLSVAGMVKLDSSFVGLSDGSFEVSLVRYPETLTDLNALMSEVVAQNYGGKYFSILKARRVRFIFEEEVPFTRDGEPGGSYRELVIENRPSAISMIV